MQWGSHLSASMRWFMLLSRTCLPRSAAARRSALGGEQHQVLLQRLVPLLAVPPPLLRLMLACSSCCSLQSRCMRLLQNPSHSRQSLASSNTVWAGVSCRMHWPSSFMSSM